VPPLTALAIVEATTGPSLLRTVLRSAVALLTLGGMAVWVRANRAALDLEHWCACAPSTITVRVIESRRPHPIESPTWAETVTVVARVDAETEPELVPR
jgi:hypothetical protein